jgi:hypothetical protein
MKILDFIIGLTLMNAMPHFVLGVWKGKMLSGFGTGNKRNILWALFNFVISVGLFIFKYGLKGFVGNTMYSGALLVLVVFFFTSSFWVRFYGEKSE